MHSIFRTRGAALAGLFALALTALAPSVASAKPEPGARPRQGFRLFARPLGAMTINRIYCGLSSTGEVCVDSSGSSTIGGGFWPKGTGDQYIFNSGLQIAGKIGPDGGPWAGDITGAFLFDPKGTTQHGEQVQPIYNSSNPADVAIWPEAAKVPLGDANQEVFNPVLRGRVNAGQGDVWWLTWDGNPALKAGRSHPLGVLVEQRGLGFNYPTGNEDILYFIYTFYNITSANAADYAAIRPGMREIAIQQATKFHQLNPEVPAGGYTLTDLYAAFAADMDVASAGVNYSTVNLPFALGFSYEQAFDKPQGWQFDPSIFGGNQFAGVGFIGVKYLKSPTGPGAIQLFSNTVNGGSAFNDPRDVAQLYRYLSGNLQTGVDANCNVPGGASSHVCFVNQAAADTRFFQSSTALELKPGQFGSIVVAYINAAPTKVASFVPGGDQKPGDPLATNNVTKLSTPGAVNMIDSLTGYKGWHDVNGDGKPQQNEFSVVKGSLLDKALVAQTIFDHGFLLPEAPASPDFFLVPGDNQVTIFWRPSPSEATGDAYFQVASAPTTPDPVSGLPVTNPLFDPNYRQFDVEGYRIWRGRVDSPNELALVAQFDYAGTVIKDFTGQINPNPGCAPELAIPALPTAACPFERPPAGVAPTVSNDLPLVGEIIQVRPGGRTPQAGTVTDTVMKVDTLKKSPLVTDTTFLIHTLAEAAAILPGGTDTLITGGGSGLPALSDNGVPFSYVDHNVRNGFRYFYAVTAFDVNSITSGPSSLESPKSVTKAVVPQPSSSNLDNKATVTSFVAGRGGTPLDASKVPTIDPVTGKFSGPFPAANGGTIGFVGEFARQVVATGGVVSATLDSIVLGNAEIDIAGVPHQYFFTVTGPAGSTKLVIPVQMEPDVTPATGQATAVALNVDQGLAARYGGSANNFGISVQLSQTIPGSYNNEGYGRGCANAAAGFTSGKCMYGGARWFDGPSPQKNETLADPNANQVAPVASPVLPNTSLNTGGQLTGVANIYEARGYVNVSNAWRDVESYFGGANRAADFNVYWGTAGKIDSVVDATHNVVVPFSDHFGGGWGILNQATAAAGSMDERPELSPLDIGCVGGIRGTDLDALIAVNTPCADPQYLLTQTAVPGPVWFWHGGYSAAALSTPAQPNPGFGLYLPGHFFLFELAGGTLPAQGTVWTLRSYTGAVNGGKGLAGDKGPYSFAAATRPFTAVGASLNVRYDVTNQLVAATKTDLEKVHTVPDPYYVTNAYEQATEFKVLKFVNLPAKAIIRIYTSSGVLVKVIEHAGGSSGVSSEENWDLRNRNNQVVASGVYFYHIESGDARRVGRFTVVNFAQ